MRAGAQDPACCGGELVEWQWAPGKDKLTAAAATATGRLSLDTLSGTEWVLQAWTIGEPVESTPSVTLKFDSNRFTGASGCNRYAVGVQGTATPGEISVGLIAGTRMACPEHESARADGALGTMLFEQTPIAPDALGGAKY